MEAAEGGFPSISDILGSRWENAISQRPELMDRVDVLFTEPPRSESRTGGPWRIVAVRAAGPDRCWQAILAREYW